MVQGFNPVTLPKKSVTFLLKNSRNSLYYKTLRGYTFILFL